MLLEGRYAVHGDARAPGGDPVHLDGTYDVILPHPRHGLLAAVRPASGGEEQRVRLWDLAMLAEPAAYAFLPGGPAPHADMRLVRLALNGWLANAGSPPPAELRLVGARAAGLRDDGLPIGPHDPHRLAFLLPDVASPEMEFAGAA